MFPEIEEWRVVPTWRGDHRCLAHLPCERNRDSFACCYFCEDLCEGKCMIPSCPRWRYLVKERYDYEL